MFSWGVTRLRLLICLTGRSRPSSIWEVETKISCEVETKFNWETQIKCGREVQTKFNKEAVQTSIECSEEFSLGGASGAERLQGSPAGGLGPSPLRRC